MISWLLVILVLIQFGHRIQIRLTRCLVCRQSRYKCLLLNTTTIKHMISINIPRTEKTTTRSSIDEKVTHAYMHAFFLFLMSSSRVAPRSFSRVSKILVYQAYRRRGHSRCHVTQTHTRTRMTINQFYTIGTSVLSENNQTSIFPFNRFQEKHI